MGYLWLVVKVKVTLRLTVSQPVQLGDEPHIYYSLAVTVLLLWGALSDERTGLSFVYAAGPRQRSLPWVRVPWHLWPYFTVSDLRLPFSSPPTTCRVTVEVFDPASTWVWLVMAAGPQYIASVQTTHKALLPTALLLLRVFVAAFMWWLLSHRPAKGTFMEPFHSNSCLCWHHNSGFQQTCHNIISSRLISQS
jgi:hypothetical protein